MKTFLRISTLALAATVIFSSCKKEDSDRSFSSANPQGYVISGTFRHEFIYKGMDQPIVIKFLGDNKVEWHTVKNTWTREYRMINDTFYFDRNDLESFAIKDGKVTWFVNATDIRGWDLSLQKEPGKNELEGKTFTGVYYKPNGTVLHASFFYNFIAGNKSEAGYTEGTVVRTDAYTSIANLASRSNPAAGQTEFTMLFNSKLYAYYETSNTLQYAKLEPK
ncbi:MAG: hypothetical protein EOO09_00285 [Chitinophagaceae bacterium]|nr:MAG: hypothetical protein EOO09_00285 [Chitinophagaceae bacterium]